jgi:flagellar hook protein FlgE
MSIYSSFYSSLSGLSANSGMLGVIGNNLANLNTVGFKGSSSSFQDLFSSTVGSNGTSGNGNPMQVGLGTRIGGISQNFGQGSFQTTGNVTDMAVSGQGLFMVQDSDGSQAYTRAGNFNLNSNGILVNPDGSEVLGWNRVGNVLSTNGTVVPIRINSGTVSPPTATTTVSTTTNLNSSDAIGTTFSTPVQVYDSLGAAHTILATYTKRAPTAAETTAGATSAWDVTGTSGDLTAAGSVTMPTPMLFNNSGILISPAANANIAVTGWSDGAANSSITWNIWGSGSSTITGFASASATSATTQDGSAAGTVSSLVVDQNGIITGNFTNGQTIQLAQVALATFSNMNGLSKQGNNSWTQTLASGAPNIGAANQGGRGTILGGQLELSNVDTATEFTQLIVAQRGYEANSRIVSTANTLLQDVLNMVPG